MRYRSILYLSAGHLFADISQGAIPALLPFFITAHDLSYTAAASIVFASNIASSLVQPFLGHAADKLKKVWLAPLGILLAGTGLALSGVTASFPLILAAVAVSGLGTSAFHPDGARLTNRLAAGNKAWGMSVFAVGGNAGFAIGPLVATGLVLAFGLPGIALFALPAVLTAAFLHYQFRDISLPAPQPLEAPGSNCNGLLQDQWFAFLRLSGIVVARSVIFFGLNTFIPLYWINVLHQSSIAGGTALTILFSLGIFTTLIGGRIADRLGYRRTIIAGFALLLPLLLAFTHSHDTFWATALLIPISLGLFGIYGPIIATGQTYLPARVGLASGITIGLAGTSGGLAAPLLGWLADINGIQTALQCLVAVPALALILAFGLPADKSDRQKQ